MQAIFKLKLQKINKNENFKILIKIDILLKTHPFEVLLGKQIFSTVSKDKTSKNKGNNKICESTK